MRGSASIGGLVTGILSFSATSFSVGVSEGNDVGSSFCSFLFNDDASSEMFGTNERNSLQRSLKGYQFHLSRYVSKVGYRCGSRLG